MQISRRAFLALTATGAAASAFSLPAFADPEIRSADLAGLLLDCAEWGVADPRTLAFLDAPPDAALAAAREELMALGAIDAFADAGNEHRHQQPDASHEEPGRGLGRQQAVTLDAVRGILPAAATSNVIVRWQPALAAIRSIRQSAKSALAL